MKTFNPSPLASKSHKRKASTSSLFTINSTSEATSTSSSTSKKFFNGVSATNRSGRSFSTSAIPLSSNGIPSSTPTFLDHNGKPCPAPPVVRHKRARRSSSIVSSLAFTSNSLVPILSSAFLKTNNNDNRANSPNNKNKEEVTHTSLRNVIGGSSSSYSTSKDIKLGDKDDLALYKEEKENQAPTGAQEPCDPRKITTQHLISLGKMRSITFIPGRNKSNLRSIHKPSGRVWTVPPLEKDTKTTP